MAVIAVFLAVVPAVQAGDVLVGTFGAPAGEGNGQLSEPMGVAVNMTGAGGVSPGDVYVADHNNNRISEFSATGVFVRAFGRNVVASGPDDKSSNNEVQSLVVKASSGTFTLSANESSGFENTVTTGPLSFNASAATVEAALNKLGGGGVVSVSVSGGPGDPTGSAPYLIAFNGFLADRDVGQITVNTAGLGGSATAFTVTNGGSYEVCTVADICRKGDAGGGAGGLFPQGVAVDQANGNVYVTDVLGDVAKRSAHRVDVYSAAGAFELAFGYDVVASGPDNLPPAVLNERQNVHTGPATGGTFKLAFNAQTTAPIPYNASAGELKAALEALPSIGAGNVEVMSIAGQSWLVEFVGAFAGVNVAAMTADFSSLSNQVGAGLETTRDGGPHPVFEVCKASAGDVCQTGQSGRAAGQFGEDLPSLPAVAPDGDLYVPDGGNARLEEFAPTINGAGEVTSVSFVRAFGWDVVESGPDNVIPVNAVQRLTIPPSVTGGTFTLTFAGQSTEALPYNIDRNALSAALNALGTVGGVGGAIRVLEKGEGVWELVFERLLEDVPVGRIGVDSSMLTGGEASVSVLSEGVSPYEQCDTLANPSDVCKRGIEGSHPNQFSLANPRSVAVDSTGAIYTVDDNKGICSAGSRCRVLKFDPSASESSEFAPAYLTGAAGERFAHDPTDVAVDPANDHVLVAKKEGKEAYRFLEFDASGTLLGGSPGEGKPLQSSPGNADLHGLTVGTGGRFYFVNTLGLVDAFGPPPAPSVSIAPATSVGASTATFHGTVTPPGPVAGEYFDTTYHFEYSVDGVHWSRLPAEEVDVGNGSGAGDPSACPTGNPPSCNVSQVVTGLEPNAHYLVRLVATTGTAATSLSESFVTGAAAPSVSGLPAEEVAQTSATLESSVNPNNDATTYLFQWGATVGYGSQTPAGSAGSGGEPVKAGAAISGLQSGSVYHYRVVATNGSGTTDGPDREFVTLDSSSLPDHRASEQVSPADKRPVGLIAALISGQITVQVAADGNSTVYPVLNGLSGATTGGNVSYLARREGSGWLSTQLSPPSLVGSLEAGSPGSDQSGHVLYNSPDLSCGLVASRQPLTVDTPEEDVTTGIENLYRRNPDGTYTLLTAMVPLNHPSTVSGALYSVDGASTDCGRVLFESRYRLLGEAPNSAKILYEWVEGTLTVAGVLHDNSVAGDAAGGGPGSRNPVSADGSRVFFTATSDEGADSGKRTVFVREAGTGSVDVSQSQTLVPNPGPSTYQMVSADGSHVFFTARYGLAANATSTGATSCEPIDGTGCDLYSYNTKTKALTDLSADANPGDVKGAGVAGVIDVSTDGSYAYFAARGRLVPGYGGSEAQNVLSASYNVYESHEGTVSYVGLVAAGDMTGQNEGSDGVTSQGVWAADATPDGTHLLFVSHSDVTGYVSGGVLEAYLYSTSSGETVCVSCRTDGKPAIQGTGGYDTVEPIAAENQHESLSDSMMVKPRAISDDGQRVFFKMHDALAPGAVSGRRNFYEWENGQVYLLIPGEGGGEADLSEYLGSSANGNDVFLRTTSKLVSQDFDNTTDVYDLRAPHVPGETVGSPVVPPPPPPCDPLNDECQGEALLQPPPGTPLASELFSGPGNPPPPPVKKKPIHKKKIVHKKNAHKKSHKKGHKKSVHKKKGAGKDLRARTVGGNGRTGR